MSTIFSSSLGKQAWANRVDPDQMPQNIMASGQILHHLTLIQQLLDTSTGS